MLTFFKFTMLTCILIFGTSCSDDKQKQKTVVVPEKITYLFVTQPSCPSCDKLEETMKLKKPKELLERYFEVKKTYLGEKLPDTVIEPQGTPTVYFLGSNDEVLVEPMIGEKSEEKLLEFLEDALYEFKRTYHVDLEEKYKLEHPKELLANIPEASSIDYCKESNTLVVANDEGSFYELNTTGEMVREEKLGDYDLEGVLCKQDAFLFAVEGGSILKVDRKTLEKKEFKIKGEGFKLTKKHGIEGIANIDGELYVTIQSKKKEHQSKLLKLKVSSTYAKVKKVIEHDIVDSSGLTWHNDQLYIVSDKKDKLYVYDVKKERVLKKIKLPKFAQEGIAFDNNGSVYFADDNGRVLKYEANALGL